MSRHHAQGQIKWVCHICHSGPYLFVNTIRCSHIIISSRNSVCNRVCNHDFCDFCKADNNIPLPLETTYSKPLMWSTSTAPVLSDTDSESESVASFAFSDASVASIESSITDYSQDEIQNAYADLLALIAYDRSLRPLFVTASKSNELSAEDFTSFLRRSLKKFAQDLRSEVRSKEHERAVSFISSRARILARQTVNIYLNSNKPWEQYPGVSYTGQDIPFHGEDGEDVEGSEQPVNFASMKAFIRSSTAFSKLIARLDRHVHESFISWDSVAIQWEEDLHTAIPRDLPGNPTTRILDSDDVSLVDVFKLALERYSGEQWLWKPFAEPRRKLANGKLRVRWKCVSTRLSAFFSKWGN